MLSLMLKLMFDNIKRRKKKLNPMSNILIYETGSRHQQIKKFRTNKKQPGDSKNSLNSWTKASDYQ